MKKKTIIKSILLFVLIIATYFTAIGFSSSEKTFFAAIKDFFVSRSVGPRMKYNFNYDWYFAKGTGYINKGSDLQANPIETYTLIASSETPYSNDYSLSNDSRWQQISLAHTFNDIDTFNNFTESGMHGERSQYAGSSWYKKDFFVPSSYAGKKVYIEFEAARQVAEVYVNGVKLTGTYQNGFIPFGYDLTPYLTLGATNHITVMVDNTFPYYLATGVVIPWHDSHWHPNYGGLYRNSYLYVVDALHLTLPLYSFLESEGTYVYTQNENGVDETAELHVDAQIENSRATAEVFDIRAKVYNPTSDTPVLTLTQNNISLASGAKTTIQLSGEMTDVIRWSTEYPYLYTVDVEILQNDVIIDNNSTEFGVRTYRFTNDYGFYLNENYIELNGWGQKTTMEYAGLGAAYPDWMTDKIIKQMKDAGGNYIRWGHVAGSPAQIASANKYGVLVTQPGVDGEGESYNATNAKLRVEAFRDLVIYYRNNPSIILWEIGNQSTSMSINVDVSSVGGFNDYGNTSGGMAALMYFLANKYDYGNRTTATAGTISNAGSYANTFSESERPLTIRRGSTDIKNYVEVAETTDSLSSSGMSSTELGAKPSVEAEYNRYESRRGIYNNDTAPFTAQNAYHMTGEDYAKIQVTTYNSMLVGSMNTGGANWIFSDSTSHGRINTEVARTSGEVDATMLEKEAYYVDQVLFSETPKSYIIGHWNYAVGNTRTVYVVAKNVDHIKLLVNDTEYVGTLSEKYLYTFSNVAWESGTIRVVAYDATNNVIPSGASSKTTHGTPAALKFTLINGNEGIKANGSDIVLVDVEVIDANGNRCITYDGSLTNDLINFSLTGDTNKFTWRGGYNSGILASTNNMYLYAEAGITRVAIRTGLQAGTIYLNGTTSSTALTSATPLTITSSNIINEDIITGLTKVSTLTTTANYSLTGLTDPGYGDASKLGLSEIENTTNSSILVADFTYSGTVNDANGIADALSVGKKLYSDENVTFTSVPYKYLNAEYLLLPNADASNTVADFITIVAKKNIDVYILRDPVTTVLPASLSSYTLVSDTIIGGNGVEYNMYKRSYAKGSLVTISSNVDNINNLNDGNNQIVIFKETTKVNNQIFFNESFDDYTADSITNGWHSVVPINSSISVDTILNGNTLKFIDNTTDIAYIQKSFAPLSNFKLKWKAYITDATNSNSWLRVWLGNSPILSQDDKTNVAIETYMDSNDDGVFVTGRTIGVNNIATTGVDQLINGLSYNDWNNFEIYVDCVNHRYRIKVNDGTYSSYHIFNAPTYSSLNNVVFGTWVNGTSEYYIDDVEILPTADSVIDNVVIDGVSLANFDDLDFDYYVSNLSSTSTITFDQSYYYSSSTITYDQENSKLILNVLDRVGETWTYNFYNMYDNDVFGGWIPYLDTDVIIEPATIGGAEAIHMVDTATADLAYIQREISPNSSKYEISFDFYVPSNSYMSTWNRVWLLNGVQNPTNNTSKTNVAIESYFQKSAGHIVATARYGNPATQLDGTLTYSLATWHNYKLVVDETAKKYNLYIDDELQFGDDSDVGYLVDVADINHLVIGTVNSTSGEIYIKNYQFNDIYNSPLSGVSIDGVNLIEFAKNVTEYTVYRDTYLDNDTVVALQTEEYINTQTITKDTLAQTVTIVVTDLSGESYTYVINILQLQDRPITLAMLQTLIATIDNDYTATNYSQRTWNELMDYVDVGRLYDDNTPQASISLCYYNIEVALSGLIMMNQTNDKSSLVNVVNVSSDLIGNYTFGKVLENDINVYENDSNYTFRSVPKRYMNANYFVSNRNLVSLDGEINLIAKRNVSVLILKDRDAGGVIDTTFTDTGDIVTASNGTDTIVYKVYRKDYTSGTQIFIDTKILLTNRINGFNNIIAIKDQSEVANNYFVNDNFANYATIEDFNNTWDYYVYDSAKTPSNNNQILEVVGGYKAVRMESNAGGGTAQKNSFGDEAARRSFVETSRPFAKLYGKISMSFEAMVTAVSTDYDNNFIRAGWLVVDAPSTWEIGTDDVKTNVYNETYFGKNSANNYSMFYRYDSTTNAGKTNANINRISVFDSWLEEIKYIVDIRNGKFDAYYGDVLKGSNLNTYQPAPTAGTYANHLLFGTRATGFSKYWFRDVKVEPIEDNLISAIQVNGNTVEDTAFALESSFGYNSVTKDYLYSSSDLTNKVVTVTNGTNYGTITQTATTNYSSVALTSSAVYGSIELDHRIYYEITGSRVPISTTIEEALDLIQSKYTATSWADLVIALNAATDLLDSHEENPTTVATANTNLRNAIDGLVLKNALRGQYTGSLAQGISYENDPSNDINITYNSGVTLNVLLNLNVGSTYSYASSPHLRKLTSSVVFPEGTIITMVDKSTGTNKYYYYEVTATDVTNLKKEYPLADFTLMGSTTNYHNLIYYDSVAGLVHEEFDFLVDFENTTTNLANGTYTIKMETIISGETINMDNKSYTIYDSFGTTFAYVSSGEESYSNDSLISLSINEAPVRSVVNGKTVYNTSYEGTMLGVRFSLYDNSNNRINLPPNMTVSYGNQICRVQNNYCTLVFGEYLEGLNVDVSLNFGAFNNITTGTYWLRTDFVRSDDGVTPGLIISTINTELMLNSKATPGFKVVLDSNKDNRIKRGTNYTLIYDITKTNISNENIVVYISKKVGDSYVIDNLANYVNESMDGYSTNKYSLGNVIVWEPTLANTIPEGTYRLTFELYKGATYLTSINKYFIVK